MRLLGKSARLFVGGVQIGTMANTEVTINTRFEEADVYGEEWDTPVPFKGNFSVRAEKFCVSGDIGQLLALAVDTPSASAAATIIVYQGSDSGSRVFEGPVWVEESTYSQPAGQVQESASFKGAGTPTYPT